MRMLVLLVVATITTASCDGGVDAAPGARRAATTTMTYAEQPASQTTADEPLARVPGRAVVLAGTERFEFIVFECLVGERETGSPGRRLALSAGVTEPFLESDLVLHVDILVSQVTGAESHRMTITPTDGSGPSLGAADDSVPALGGRAPEDWIFVEAATNTVSGRGFDLRSTSPNAEDDALGPGELVADCPEQGLPDS